MVLGLACILGRHVIDNAVGKRRHKLAVGHVVGEICPAEKVLAATGAAHIGNAPNHALDAISAAGDVNAKSAFEPCLGHRIVGVVRIGILQRRELSRIGVISTQEGILRDAAQLGELAVRIHGVVCVGNLAAAIDCSLKHAVLSRIVVIDLLHKRNKRPTAVELVITQRVVSVAIRKTLVVIAVALVLGKVLHLVSHVDKRNALNRPQHAREGLLDVQALIDIGGIRGNARSGLLGYSCCGCGNGAKRKRQRQARNNREMLGLHTSSLHWYG